MALNGPSCRFYRVCVGICRSLRCVIQVFRVLRRFLEGWLGSFGGFRVSGLGFRVLGFWGLGFRGLGFRV